MNTAKILTFVLVDAFPLLLVICGAAFTIKRQIECAKDPFVCPHCGTEFYLKWWQLFLWRYFWVELTGKVAVKCPHCEQKDRCRWTGKER